VLASLSATWLCLSLLLQLVAVAKQQVAAQ
jgi:hypothetical protein